jgi:hypothetical protein
MNTGISVKVRKDLHSNPQVLNDEHGHMIKYRYYRTGTKSGIGTS